jgi:hypothetical protein
MPYDLRIIRSGEFMRADADGHFDLAASRALFLDVILACANCGVGCALLDVRDAVSDMTAAQLCTLADVCRKVSPPGDQHKIAILTRPQLQFDRAAWLATVAGDEGWNITAFHEFENAFEWLID